MPSAPRLPGGNQFPPDAPLRSPRGTFARFSGLLSPARNVSTLMSPGFAPPGVTSNKGACSLVLANSGPLRPPVRRTSAPLRCSSSPNGNGRFRWERSRSEISELSPLGGSERCAACGDAFGRWGGGSQEGEYEIPLLSVSLVPFCTSRKEHRALDKKHTGSSMIPVCFLCYKVLPLGFQIFLLMHVPLGPTLFGSVLPNPTKRKRQYLFHVLATVLATLFASFCVSYEALRPSGQYCSYFRRSSLASQ